MDTECVHTFTRSTVILRTLKRRTKHKLGVRGYCLGRRIHFGGGALNELSTHWLR